MAQNNSNRKPDIFWLEGLLDYFNAPFPHEPKDPRELGFVVGKQVIGLYLAELLLKYALDKSNRPHGRKHDLYNLFRNLPRTYRQRVEKKYSELLFHSVDETWDFAKSVESLLQYLGDNAITDTRYFWEQSRSRLGPESIMFSTQILYQLIYALFIVLHKYPQGGSLEKRFETRFLSFQDSIKESNEQS